ncbi:NADPH-dependent FMN reductase [Streptomyces sp. TE33382]
MPTSRVVLLLSGSLRAGSSNETVLRTAQDVAPASVRTVFYEGLGDLPHFNPDDDTDPLPKPVTEMRGRDRCRRRPADLYAGVRGDAARVVQEPPRLDRRRHRDR